MVFEIVLAFAWKTLVTAALVVAASRVAERAGPVMASILITLPFNAGPGFFFLALDQPAAFISAGALYGLAAAGPVLVFSAVYVRLSRAVGFALSIAAAAVAWLVAAAPAHWLAIDLAAAFGYVAAGVVIALALRRPVDLRPPPASSGRAAWGLIVTRALAAGIVVASVATAGGHLGPELSGLALGFPATFSATAWMLYRLYGREFTAATIFWAQRGLASYVGFCLVLHLAAGALPPMAAFALAIAGSIAIAAGLAHDARRRNRAP